MKDLPKEILKILNENDAPALLKRHLILVYNVGITIIEKLTLTWPNLPINKKEILFGTATHDIGKIIEIQELNFPGKKHEIAGYKFLINKNISENFARFAKTHGDWKTENLKIEDLIVILSDKIWKGNRINELEERITTEIAKILNIDYWDVYVKLDTIISNIILGAGARLSWQGF